MRAIHKLMLLSGVVACLFLIAAAVEENLAATWRGYQLTYASLAVERASSDVTRQAAAELDTALKQIVYADGARVDRCVSCHVGVTNPDMAGVGQPLSVHPGDLLAIHPPSEHGCTLCHDGLGRSIHYIDGVGHDEAHWLKPQLHGPFLEANCARCHADGVGDRTPVWGRGRALFESLGCKGCHRVDGKGGGRGADLSKVGGLDPHVAFPVMPRSSLPKEVRDNTNLAYLYESVRFPKAQPVESGMVDFSLSHDDALALTVYLKSLQAPVKGAMTVASLDPQSLGSPVTQGAGLYAAFCSACHGSQGEGTHLDELSAVGPAIGNPRFLAVATPKMLEHLITVGKGIDMPPWGRDGGLSKTEISAIVAYLESLREVPPSWSEVAAIAGDASLGHRRFDLNCAGCHGQMGARELDLIGPVLGSPELLALSDPKWLYETLSHGRPGSAMPAWSFFTAREMADIIAYFQRLASGARVEEVLGATARQPARGRSLYRRQCLACHGDAGRGGWGPTLDSPELHALADDRFFATTLIHGRRTSGMPTFAHLTERDLADILGYVRTLAKRRPLPSNFRPIAATPARPLADWRRLTRRGEQVFASTCAACHGDDGQGGVGPAITGHDFLASVDDTFLVNMIAWGRSGSGMHGVLNQGDSFAALDEIDVHAVVAWLREQEAKPATTTGRRITAGNANAGARVFDGLCAGCHGNDGLGGTGPAIATASFQDSVSDGFLAGTILMGRSHTEMRGFGVGRDGLARLSDRELTDLIAFLRRAQDRKAEPFRRVVGNVATGRRTYVGSCSACHGRTPGDGFAPDLFDPRFLAAADDAYLQATMALGRHNTMMRSMIRGFGGLVDLESRDVSDVIAYLRATGEAGVAPLEGE